MMQEPIFWESYVYEIKSVEHKEKENFLFLHP